jgi:hypothetical protein
MQLTDIFLRLGRDHFSQLLRTVSIGRLKTFQLFERVKARLHLSKLNSEALRKAEPRIWGRIEGREEDFASDVAQAILVSHMDMIRAVLDHLEIPHEDGFFAKNASIEDRLKDGWQQAAWERFRETYSPAALLFYINHLGWEVAKTEDVFAPAD